MNELVEITKADIENAALLSNEIKDLDEKKKLFVTALGLNAVCKYLKKADIENSLYKIPDIFNKYDIADLYYKNGRIDVRSYTGADFVYLPKIHYENNLLPDFYVCTIVDIKDNSTKILGYLNPNDVDKSKETEHYYLFPLEELKDIKTIGKEMKSVTPKNQNISEEEMDNLISKYSDNETDDFDVKYLVQNLLCSYEGREKFISMQEMTSISENCKFYPDLFDVQEENYETVDEEELEETEEENLDSLPEDTELEENLELVEDIDNLEDATENLLEEDNSIFDEIAEAENSVELDDIENSEEDILKKDENSKDESFNFDDLSDNNELISLEAEDIKDESEAFDLEDVSDDTSNQGIMALPDLDESLEEAEEIDELKDAEEEKLSAQSSFEDNDNEEIIENTPSYIEEEIKEEPKVEPKEEPKVPEPPVNRPKAQKARSIYEEMEAEKPNAFSELLEESGQDVSQTNKELSEYDYTDLDEILEEHAVDDEEKETKPSTPTTNNDETPNLQMRTIYDEEGDNPDEEINLNEQEYEQYVEAPKASSKPLVKAAVVLLVILILAGGSLYFLKDKIQSRITPEPIPSTVAQKTIHDFDDNTFEEIGAEPKDVAQNGEEEQEKAAANDINKVMADVFDDNASSVAITKISWEVPEKYTTSQYFRKYLQVTGINLQNNLQEDLMKVSDISTTGYIKLSFVVTFDNVLKSVKVVESSGSKAIDDVVVQSLKTTISYIKIPEIPGAKKEAEMAITISF